MYLTMALIIRDIGTFLKNGHFNHINQWQFTSLKGRDKHGTRQGHLALTHKNGLHFHVIRSF
jgi:hypothetical protein